MLSEQNFLLEHFEEVIIAIDSPKVRASEEISDSGIMGDFEHVIT